MNDASSDVDVKAAVAAIVTYATAMGSVGAYLAVQCGKHWFTYSVISFLPYAVPGIAVEYFIGRWLLSQYNFGQVRHWLLAAGISVLFFIGCFIFAHLQPEMQLFSGVDCQPFW